MATVVDSASEKVADKGEMNGVTKEELSTTENQTLSVDVADSSCEIKTAENGHVDVVKQLKTVETEEKRKIKEDEKTEGDEKKDADAAPSETIKSENGTAVEGHKLEEIVANGSANDGVEKVAQVETVDSFSTGKEAADVADKMVANGSSEAEKTVEEAQVDVEGVDVMDVDQKEGVVDTTEAEVAEDGNGELTIDVPATVEEIEAVKVDGSPEAIIDVIGDGDAMNGQNGIGVDEDDADMSAAKLQNGKKDGDGDTLAVVTNGAAKEEAAMAVECDGEATKRKTLDASGDMATEKKPKLDDEEPVARLADD